MARKINQNSFDGGLNTDVNTYTTPSNVLINAKNITQTTLAEDQFILQSENGNTFIRQPNGLAVKVSDGFTPIAVKVFNNIAYIISVGKYKSESPVISEYVGEGLTVEYNALSKEYIILGTVLVPGSFRHVVGTLTTIPLPSTYIQFKNYPTDLTLASDGRVFNHAVAKGVVMPSYTWPPMPLLDMTEIGTFPSPNWEIINNKVNGEYTHSSTPLEYKYSPLYNFKDWGQLDYDGAFRAVLGQVQNSEIDIELQPSFDGSINIIFTDGETPIKLVNSRFKPKKGNSDLYVVADRTDLATSDSNEYSAENIDKTQLVFNLSKIPKLSFEGVIPSAGRLPEGNYRYYFKAVDADGNETSIIEESRTVSIFSGNGRNAHTTEGGISSKAARFLIEFDALDLESISGVDVFYTYFKGDFETSSSTYKILTTYRNKEDNSFSIVHTGLEKVESVAIADLNVQYTPVKTAKTLSQIRSRLALANVTYAGIDTKTLAEASYRIQIYEENYRINRSYSDVFIGDTSKDDILYSTPEDIYGEETPQSQTPGIGYWEYETYVCGVNWILENDFVTDSYPISGVDRLKGWSYISVTNDTHDYNKEPFNSNNNNQNRLGVYRTSNYQGNRINSSGKLNVKKLFFKNIGESIAYLKSKGVPVKGYFFTRKKRIKDTLLEGIVGGLHRFPITQNFQAPTTVAYSESNANNNRSYFMPIIGGHQEGYESMTKFGIGDKEWEIRDGVEKDYVEVIEAGLKLVPSNAGWVEGFNPQVIGKDDGGITDTIDGSFIRDVFYFKETGAYDYRQGHDNKWSNRKESGTLPNYNYVNRVAFHSMETLTDLPSVNRIFETNPLLEIARYDYSRVGFKDSEIGSGGRAKISKFYLEKRNTGSYGTTNKVLTSARYIGSGDDVGIEEQYSAATDRNIYKGNSLTTAYEYKTYTGLPYWSYTPNISFIYGRGKFNGPGGIRMYHALRGISHVASDYGGFHGCNILNKDGSGDLVNIAAINSGHYNANTRARDYPITSTQRRTFGRYTKVYSNSGTIKDNEVAWKALYSNLSGTYNTISKRYSIDSTDNVYVGEGDCFMTIGWKQLTKKKGLPTSITDSFPKISVYFAGVDTDESPEESLNIARSASDVKDSVTLGYSQGFYMPLIHQNNNNVAIRQIEKVENTEKNLLGTDREFYPYTNDEALKGRPQIESNKYNFGLNYKSDKIYSATDINVPATISTFKTRVVLSNSSSSSDFSNGYRSFQNINFRDYNQDFGGITKLISFNNTLYCIQESAVSLIDVDSRTLTTDAAVGKVFINSAELLPSTLTNINSEFGSTKFYSVIKTDVGIFGVDYVKNRPWKLDGSGLNLISEFKVQTLLNKFKKSVSSLWSSADIRTHFDRSTNKVYFNYDKSEGIPLDQNLAYNTTTKLWIGEVEFTPGISFNIEGSFYSIKKYGGIIYEHNTTEETIFYGSRKQPQIEVVMLGDNPTGQKILDNLKIVSNNVVPIEYTYTIEDTITYNKDGNHALKNHSLTEPAIVRGDKIIRNGTTITANILQANTQYKENTMDVQIGKASGGAKIRDKAIKIKLTYSGESKVFIQQVISLYRDSFA